MADDWIRMRPSLMTSPKVIGIAREIEDRIDVGRTLSTGFNGALREIVTRDVTRDVTLASLLRVWGAANEHTKDGVFRNSDLENIDDIAGIPGFGDAMAAVGWAVYDESRNTVTLPNFNEYNTSGHERKQTAAERQRKYRERKASGRDESVTSRCATRDVTRDDREEKRREEVVPKGTTKSQTKSATPRTPTFSEWDRQFAERMHADILRVAPGAKAPAFDAWANDLRLMRESDSRTEAEIAALWEFANGDDFWRANILSPRKLREKWTQLSAKRAATQRGSPGRQSADKFQGNREFLERLRHESGEIQSADGATDCGGGQSLLG